MRCHNMPMLVIILVLAVGQLLGAGDFVSSIPAVRGRMLAFLLGLGCSRQVWAEVMDTLSVGYRFMRVAVAGFAASLAPESFQVDALFQAVGDVLSSEQAGRE